MTDVWVQIVVTVGIIAVAIINKRDSAATRREVRAVRADTAAVREQTENSHATAEFPNLREQQDAQLALSRATHDEVLAVKEAQRGIERRMDRIERQTRDLRESDEATDETLDRQKIGQARALARAVAERDEKLNQLERRFEQRVPEIIAAALVDHVRACPLRRDTPPSAASPV